MIVAYLQGGLGNQLFQFAFASRLAEARGCGVVIDPHWFDHPRPGETARTFELPKLRAKFTVADEATSRRWHLLRHRFAKRLPQFLLPLRLMQEKPGGFDPDALGAPDGSYLRGYWQSEQYFADIAPALSAAFEPSAAPSRADQMLLDRMQGPPAVSLHVRRGDYVSLAAAARYHGTCSLDYYGAAVRHVLERTEGARFFIFSDDPKWAADNLEIPAETHFVSHNSAADAVQDLRLMSHCRHHIIANSSFSWWGAWLSEQRGARGIVIAPRSWFAGRDADDLVPSRWVRM